ncbi:AbrB/MazE/SpoVT family DNA-binding domain-containing protein [Candidatus Nitrosocosmicus sp. R]
MNYSNNSSNSRTRYSKTQKQGPSSVSVILPKIMTLDLGIQKGSYVMISQIGDEIRIRKIQKKVDEMYNYNQFNNNLSYKNYHGSFRKDTIDYNVGKDRLEPGDKDSLTEYCTDKFKHILENEDYIHVFQIPKTFLKFFDCSCKSEFEEKVLIPILRKLCIKYGLDFEQVQTKIFENECISYEEDFN